YRIASTIATRCSKGLSVRLPFCALNSSVETATITRPAISFSRLRRLRCPIWNRSNVPYVMIVFSALLMGPLDGAPYLLHDPHRGGRDRLTPLLSGASNHREIASLGEKA